MEPNLVYDSDSEIVYCLNLLYGYGTRIKIWIHLKIVIKYQSPIWVWNKAIYEQEEKVAKAYQSPIWVWNCLDKDRLTVFKVYQSPIWVWNDI